MSDQEPQKHIDSYEIYEIWKRENKKIVLIDNKDEFKLLIGEEQVPFIQKYEIDADRSGVTLVFELRVPREVFSNEVER